jgi:hypothetical protein
MVPLPVATDTLKPTVSVFRFPGDACAMLNVVADGTVRAWHEEKPITLSSSGDWYLGAFAVPPDADQAKLQVEIDGVRHSLVACWPKPEPVDGGDGDTVH